MWPTCEESQNLTFMENMDKGQTVYKISFVCLNACFTTCVQGAVQKGQVFHGHVPYFHDPGQYCCYLAYIRLQISPHSEIQEGEFLGSLFHATGPSFSIHR